MGRFSSEKYAPLFDIEKAAAPPFAERRPTRQEWGKKLEHGAVGCYRVKRIESGDYLEYECYPVWKWRREASRAKKLNGTEKAMKGQNEKNAWKKLIRLLNTNFTQADLAITLSYAGRPPETVEQARRDVQNYLKRIKRWREGQGLPELKYISVIECLGVDGRRKRVHHHIVMSGMDRDKAEELWGKGRANTFKLQPDEYGLEGWGRYVSKARGKRQLNEKSWTGSRNLKQPKVTVADTKLSRRAVEMALVDEETLRDLIHRKEPAHMVNDIKIKISDYVPGAYISIRMRRITPRGSPPEKKKRGRPPAGKT